MLKKCFSAKSVKEGGKWERERRGDKHRCHLRLSTGALEHTVSVITGFELPLHRRWGGSVTSQMEMVTSQKRCPLSDRGMRKLAWQRGSG